MVQKKQSMGAEKTQVVSKSSATKKDIKVSEKTPAVDADKQDVVEALSASKGPEKTPSKSKADTPVTQTPAKVDASETTNRKVVNKRGGLGFGGALALLLAGGIGGVFAAPHLASYAPEAVAKYMRASPQESASNIDARMEALEARVDDKIAAGLGQLQSAIEANATQFKDFQTQVSENLSKNDVVMSADGQSVDLAPLMAEIEMLKAENTSLNNKITEELVAVKAEAAEVVQTAQSQVKHAEATAALTNVKLKLAQGLDADVDLAALAAAGVQVPEVLRQTPEVATLEALQESYGVLASEAIRVSILATGPEGSGLLSSFGTRIKAQFAGRSTTPQEGNTPDAILSRSEAFLMEGNLQDALNEMQALSSEALSVMTPWMDRAKDYLARTEALQSIEQQISG